MKTRTLEQVEQEIAETKAALQNVHGTETEVYARIVGYYRAVKHWNNGKRDEFNLRKMFTLEDSKITESEKNVEVKAENVKKQEYKTSNQDEYVSYEMYTRKTCPNCPPVKEFMANLEISGKSIDVDTKEGLAQAAKNGVFASPTVIFYNADGNEISRCHNVEELEAIFTKVAAIA